VGRPDGESTRAYRLLDRIGEGGHGEVWSAEVGAAGGLRRKVAVKLLRTRVSHQQELEARLRDEGRILARLDHRAIVRVEDLVEIEGRQALVMELIEGVDLRNVIEYLGPIPARVVGAIGGEVAAALDAAHRATDEDGRAIELVHRDVKAENIRLKADGSVKVIDFGIARAIVPGREATSTGTWQGTAGLLSPERYDGRTPPACDVYALGIVLTQCLHGVGTADVPDAPRAREVWMAARTADLPTELRRLLRGMTAWDAAERPDAGTAARTLRRVARHELGPEPTEWIRAAVNGGTLPTHDSLMIPVVPPALAMIPVVPPALAPALPAPPEPPAPGPGTSIPSWALGLALGAAVALAAATVAAMGVGAWLGR
jgi:serine/threonine-protein kinase